MVKEDFKEEVPLSSLAKRVCVTRVQGNQGIVSTMASAEDSELGVSRGPFRKGVWNSEGWESLLIWKVPARGGQDVCIPNPAWNQRRCPGLIPIAT